jgi:uncharacterized protein YacL (UPF0231 family)
VRPSHATHRYEEVLRVQDVETRELESQLRQAHEAHKQLDEQLDYYEQENLQVCALPLVIDT